MHNNKIPNLGSAKTASDAATRACVLKRVQKIAADYDLNFTFWISKFTATKDEIIKTQEFTQKNKDVIAELSISLKDGDIVKKKVSDKLRKDIKKGVDSIKENMEKLIQRKLDELTQQNKEKIKQLETKMKIYTRYWW